LFIALSGVAYATGLKKNSVKSKQIKDGQVLTQDIGDGAVTSAKIAPGVIPTTGLADGSVTTPKLADGAVSGDKLAADSVDASKVGADALGGADIDESSLSGVDASTVGGIAASGFALAGHNHDATYVNEGQVNGVTGAMITDTSRFVQLPLSSFIECDSNAGADIDYSSGADRFPDFVNSATDGQGFFLRFDATAGTEDEDTSVCSQLQVPLDAVDAGGVSIHVVASKDSAGFNAEAIQCGTSVNGAAPVFGSQPMSIFPLIDWICSTSGTFSPHDAVTVSLAITSPTTIDSFVDVYAVSLRYTAVQ
jgi:hypothetical protein